MEKTNVMPNLCLNLVLLGKAGVGKSSTGNTILGREAFTTEKSSTSVTRDVAAEVGAVCGLPMTVYDTPGFSGTESEEELRKYEKVLQKCKSGLCAFLIVLRSDEFTEEDRETVEKIEELLGETGMQNAWILFTDELEDENKSINEIESLKKLIQKYEDRFHVINNKKGPSLQVNSLISKVFQRNFENLSSQRVVRKDHPWRKLVDPGPWYRLPPTPSAHSRHCPTTFNPFLEDDEDESKDEEVLNEDQIQPLIM